MTWYNTTSPMGPRSYDCSYCGHHTGPNTGFFSRGQPVKYVFICTFCDQPTYFNENGKQFPGAPFGSPIQSLPSDVNQLYEEIRAAMTVNAFTSVALTARKILMHVGVEKGGKADQSFQYYVDYLAAQNYIAAGSKPWVDHIRDKGNEANHEIVVTSEPDARNLVKFLEMLLKTVYEFPAAAPPKP